MFLKKSFAIFLIMSVFIFLFTGCSFTGTSSYQPTETISSPYFDNVYMGMHWEIVPPPASSIPASEKGTVITTAPIAGPASLERMCRDAAHSGQFSLPYIIRGEIVQRNPAQTIKVNTYSHSEQDPPLQTVSEAGEPIYSSIFVRTEILVRVNTVFKGDQVFPGDIVKLTFHGGEGHDFIFDYPYLENAQVGREGYFFFDEYGFNGGAAPLFIDEDDKVHMHGVSDPELYARHGPKVSTRLFEGRIKMYLPKEE